MNRITRLLCISLVILLSGCAAFRGGQLGTIENWPPAAEQKKSISYVITGKVDFNGKVTSAQPVMLAAWKRHVDRAYNEAGVFSSVSEGFSDTDIRAEIDVTDVGRGNMALAFICGLTMFVIPAKASDEFVIRTVYKDRQGNVLADITRKENVDMWMQILLLPATPFAFPVAKVGGALYDVNRATLLEAKKKSVF